MIPALQRFYGGTISEWWTMPVVELNAFSSQVDTLKAQESLRRANEIGVGTGSMKKADQTKILRDWSRDAGITAARRRTARTNAAKHGPPMIPGIKYRHV